MCATVNATDPYRNPAAYPPIQVQAPNLCYANILRQDYAGSASELTAITQYLHHQLTESGYTDVSDTLLGIAKVEMDHLHMLGETIILLGGDPIYAVGCPRTYWDAGMIDYGATLCEQLNADLSAEQGAIVQYNNHIAQIGDPYVKAILARIALDEQWHVGLLNGLISTYCGSGDCPESFC